MLIVSVIHIRYCHMTISPVEESVFRDFRATGKRQVASIRVHNLTYIIYTNLGHTIKINYIIYGFYLKKYLENHPLEHFYQENILARETKI